MTLYEQLQAEASLPESETPDGWAYTALPAVLRLIEATRELVDDYEESDPYPTSDRHPLYAARVALGPFEEQV